MSQETTSGKKIRRKVNQQYGRAMRKLMQEHKAELDRRIEEKMENLESALKPKPKWIPTPVWRWLQDLVVKRDILW